MVKLSLTLYDTPPGSSFGVSSVYACPFGVTWPRLRPAACGCFLLASFACGSGEMTFSYPFDAPRRRCLVRRFGLGSFRRFPEWRFYVVVVVFVVGSEFEIVDLVLVVLGTAVRLRRRWQLSKAVRHNSSRRVQANIKFSLTHNYSAEARRASALLSSSHPGIPPRHLTLACAPRKSKHLSCWRKSR